MIRVRIVWGGLADPGQVIPAEVRKSVVELVAYLERETKKRTPIGVTEAGRGSIAGEVGETVRMGEVIGTVGSPLKHVAVINDGRRPGEKMPPSDSLELWVRRKIQIKRTHASGKVKTRKGVELQRAPTPKEARGIAFVIARAIGKKGIEGRKFFEKAVEENQGTIQRILESAGLRIESELNRKG